MKRIGFVIVNLAGGGAERVVLHLAKMFQENSIDVHIFLLENVISYAVDESIVHPLSEKRKKYKVFKNRSDQLLGDKLKASILKIEKDGIQFDMILSNLPAADRVVSTVKLDRNIFYIMHTTYTLEIDEMRKRREYLRAYRRIRHYRKLYKEKDLISVSEGIAKDLDILDIDYASSRVIYNPFDRELIRKLGNEECLDIPNEEYIVIAAAFRKEKRLDIALKAYVKLSNPPKLKILCKWDKSLVKMIRDLNLEDKVEILGFKKNPYPYMKHAKLLILSSEREGLPTVLIESLILGTSVVSTNCHSGPNEILTGELSTYLSIVNDPTDLANKINLALKEYPKIKNSHIDKFSKENVLKNYISLFDSLVSK
jgi:glycosyltransferase involved in cell wall biosynthesis